MRLIRLTRVLPVDANRPRRSIFAGLLLGFVTDTFAYSQVFSRTFALFRVLRSRNYAADLRFPIGRRSVTGAGVLNAP